MLPAGDSDSEAGGRSAVIAAAQMHGTREWRGLQYPRWLCLVAEADDAVVGPVPAARPAGLTSASVADQACGVAYTRVATRR